MSIFGHEFSDVKEVKAQESAEVSENALETFGKLFEDDFASEAELKEDDEALQTLDDHEAEEAYDNLFGDDTYEDPDLDNSKETDGNDEAVEQIRCRNEELEGTVHPKTGVPFERHVVEVEGKQVEVVVPRFDSVFDAQLSEDKYLSSDKDQFKECNSQLNEEIASNEDLRNQFDDEQLDQIENGDTPDGYTWHHDAEAGKMQLVDTDTHEKTGHTGGRAIWGGGSEMRK